MRGRQRSNKNGGNKLFSRFMLQYLENATRCMLTFIVELEKNESGDDKFDIFFLIHWGP